MMNESVQTIMTRNPMTVMPNNNLHQVQDIFASTNIHHLPVVDEDNNLKGLITTYDLWQLAQDNRDPDATTVGEIMNSRCIKVESDDKIGTAAELFLDKRFHALPVVEDKKLVGIVTAFDVLKYEFNKEYEKPILYEDILMGQRYQAVV
jgi:CBS domain-containing protein